MIRLTSASRASRVGPAPAGRRPDGTVPRCAARWTSGELLLDLERGVEGRGPRPHRARRARARERVIKYDEHGQGHDVASAEDIFLRTRS